MKILMVNKYLYAKGGAETYLLKIGDCLVRMGHEVEYFGMEDEKNSVYNTAGEYTSNMDFHQGGIKRFLYPLHIIYSVEARRKIRKVIENFHPDIIHLNNINFQLTPSIIEEAFKLNIPIIQTVHDYQMLCPNHLFFNIHTMKPCELCLHGSPWNCTRKKCIHNSRVKSLIGTTEAILYKKRKTYDLVDLYICPSLFIEKKLLERDIFQQKTITIHNFIEQKELQVPINKRDYVIYFGRLSEEKGFEMFLESCKRLPYIKFIIAGTGPLDKLCEGIPNIDFVGFKTGQELIDLIREAKFSVYPSIWYENCPLSVLESESLGTPVLATRMGGIPELIEQDETGVLIDDINESSLTKAIESLYSDNKKLDYMSKRCIEKRDEMITLETYSAKLIELYETYHR